MRTLTQKEIKKLAQDYVAQKRKSKDVSPGAPLPMPVLLVFPSILDSQLTLEVDRTHGTKTSPSTHGLVPELLR